MTTKLYKKEKEKKNDDAISLKETLKINKQGNPDRKMNK